MRTDLFAAAFLISSSILTGFFLITGTELVFLGLLGILVSCLIFARRPIAKYVSTFYPKDK